MQEAEKMRLIEQPAPGTVAVIITGLQRKPKTYALPLELGLEINRITRNMQRLQHEKEDSDAEWISAEAAFPFLKDPVLSAARYLKGIRLRQNMTQKDLAAALDVKQHHISEMENAKRPIGKEMAKRLAKILNCDWRGLV